MVAMAHGSPALTDWSVSPSTPMLDEKSLFQTAYRPISEPPTPNTPNIPATTQDPFLHPPAESKHLTRIDRLTRYNTIFGYVLSLASVGITCVMEGIMIYVLYKFYTTKDIPAPGRVSPWAKGTTLWPTFILLVSSLITFVLDLGSLLAACVRSSKRALKLEELLGRIGLVCYVVKWIVVAALYMVGKTSKDLWGWSCDARAEKIQQFYVSNLNFKQMCLEQTIASYLSWIEGATKVVLLATTFWLTYKMKKATRERN